MKRRLYFLLPETSHAARLVDDLQQRGISASSMHTIANEGIDISSLPSSNPRQRNNTANKLENWLWDIDLILFFLALIALLLMIAQQVPGWTLIIPLAIMAVTVALGSYFIKHIPNVHLQEFRSALRHREILLMVDVDKAHVHDTLHWVEHHHPEAVTGGVSWTSTALKI